MHDVHQWRQKIRRERYIRDGSCKLVDRDPGHGLQRSEVDDSCLNAPMNERTSSKVGIVPKAALDLTRMGNQSVTFQAPDAAEPHTWPTLSDVASSPTS